MNLDERQRRQVGEWIEQGLKLSEIQGKLAKEFGITMTYMDVRFLIDDLKLKPKDILPPAPPTVAPAQPPSPPAPASPLAGTPASAAGAVPAGSSVSVTVDHVARPGAIVSGRVAFSDGKGGAWLIDQARVGPRRTRLSSLAARHLELPNAVADPTGADGFLGPANLFEQGSRTSQRRSTTSATAEPRSVNRTAFASKRVPGN
jgi:hypothetical protein